MAKKIGWILSKFMVCLVWFGLVCLFVGLVGLVCLFVGLVWFGLLVCLIIYLFVWFGLFGLVCLFYDVLQKQQQT